MAVIRKTKTKNKNNKNNKTKKHIKKYNKSRKIQRGGSEKIAVKTKGGKVGKLFKNASSWVSSKFSSGATAFRNRFGISPPNKFEVVSFENPSVKATPEYAKNPLLEPESASNKVTPASVAPIKSPLARSDAFIRRSTRTQSNQAFGLPRHVVGMTKKGFENLQKRVKQTLSATRTPNNIRNISSNLSKIKDQLYTTLPSGARQLKPLNEIGDKITILSNQHGLGDITALHRALGAGTTNFVKLLGEQQTALAKARQGAMQAATNYNQRHSLNFGEETSKLNRAAILAAEEKNPYLTIEPADPKSVEENDGYMKFG
jgi:hypothetical protein